MNKDSLKYHFLNGQSTEEFTALFFWALIGLLLSVIIELIRHKNKIKNTGKFNLSFWIQDNSLRLFASVLTILLGVLFNDDLLGISGTKGAIAVGLITDKLIEAIMKFRDTINISLLANVFNKKS